MGSRFWLSAALLFVLLRSLPNLSYPIGRDQASYCVIGQGLLDGKRLYRDFWDNRPPGLPFVFAGIVEIFGPVMWCVGIVDILWLLGISYFIFRFAERYLGPAAAAVAVACASSWHVLAGYWQAAQAETFLIWLVFAAFFLVASTQSRWRLRHFAAGLLFGAAFWLKYNALAFLPLVILLPYLDTSRLDVEPGRLGLGISRHQWLRRVVIFNAGLAVMVIAVLAYFWLGHAWGAFQQIQFGVLPRYVSMALERTPGYWFWAMNRTQLVIGQWTQMATLVALVVAWQQRELRRLGPILLAAAMGVVSTTTQVRFHDYYFETCFPFFAMIWGYLAMRLYEGFRALVRACSARGWRLPGVLLWVLLGNLFLWPVPPQIVDIGVHYGELAKWWREGEGFYFRYPWAHPESHMKDQMQMISYLQRKLAPEDRLFHWGNEPLVYFLTRRPPPSRFIWDLPLISPWSPPGWRDELVRDLEKSPPKFLIVARHDAIPNITYTSWDSEAYLKAYPELAIFINDFYEPAENLANFEIFRRRAIRPVGGPDSNSP